MKHGYKKKNEVMKLANNNKLLFTKGEVNTVLV